MNVYNLRPLYTYQLLNHHLRDTRDPGQGTSECHLFKQDIR